jgi:iron complex outermembrane receptor protein
VVAFDGADARTTTRLTGLAGVSWHAWKSGTNGLTLYADYRNSVKPLAIDFGPEAEVEVLRPETAKSYEAGLKTQLLDGCGSRRQRFPDGFSQWADLCDDGAGNFVRVNGGQTRFKGFEVESTFELRSDLRLSAHYANHDARFVSLTRDNGADASGNQVEMSPQQLAGVGLLFGQPKGTTASIVMTYVGDRYLNKSNSVRVGGYTTLDAAVGVQLGKFSVRLAGYNLTDRRDATSESDLHESVTVTGTAGDVSLAGPHSDVDHWVRPAAVAPRRNVTFTSADYPGRCRPRIDSDIVR